MDKFEFRVEIRGPRPPFTELAEHLWGAGVDFDSDGNSATAEDTNWTELTSAKRPDCEERVDIDPVSEAPLILKVLSSSRDLALRTARFLAAKNDGCIAGSMGSDNQVGAISERLWRAAARWPSPNRQELAHLEVLPSRLAPDECFAVLAEPFSKGLSERSVAIQEYAGRLLLGLSPPTPYDATQTLRLLLPKWDVSVEQLPWYLEQALGTSTLHDTLAKMQRDSELSEHIVETIKFWLRVPAANRPQEEP